MIKKLQRKKKQTTAHETEDSIFRWDFFSMSINSICVKIGIYINFCVHRIV